MDGSLNLVVDTQNAGQHVSPYLNSNNMRLVKSPKHATRCGGPVEKKSGISTILQWVEECSEVHDKAYENSGISTILQWVEEIEEGC